MPALLPIILTSHILAADTVPKFSVERTCRPAAVASILPGRDASACQRDESDARITKLEQDWTQYSAAQRAQCAGFSALDRARRATSNCQLAWLSRPKSCRLSRLWAPLQTGPERQDFLPGGLL